MAAAACLFAIGVALMAWYSPSAVLAWVLPTVTSTVTPLPILAVDSLVVQRHRPIRSYIHSHAQPNGDTRNSTSPAAYRHIRPSIGIVSLGQRREVD